MSKIAFTPNASGAGIFTVASPNTDSNYTLTLPESTSTVLTDGSQNLTSAFRLSSNLVPSSGGSQETLTSWATVETAVSGTRGQGSKGAGVSQSSGVFTFANTGYYLVSYHLFLATHTVTYAGGLIYATVNNSDYNALAESYSSTSNTSGTYYKNANMSVVFDVTDTSNRKIKFNILASGTTVTFAGHADVCQTHVIFQRVGDT